VTEKNCPKGRGEPSSGGKYEAECGELGWEGLERWLSPYSGGNVLWKCWTKWLSGGEAAGFPAAGSDPALGAGQPDTDQELDQSTPSIALSFNEKWG